MVDSIFTYRRGVRMAVKTTLEQIEEVQAAITEVMTSQELRAGGASGTIVRADLDALTKRESALLLKYQIEQGAGGPARNVGTVRRV